jgi:hypothetical protein
MCALGAAATHAPLLMAAVEAALARGAPLRYGADLAVLARALAALPPAPGDARVQGAIEACRGGPPAPDVKQSLVGGSFGGTAAPRDGLNCVLACLCFNALNC